MTSFINSKGVTLIALVISILVILILASISVTMILGDNGLIDRATNSKEANRASQIEEKKELWNAKRMEDEDEALSPEEFINSLGPSGKNLLTADEIEQILGNSSKGIAETGRITIANRTIVFYLMPDLLASLIIPDTNTNNYNNDKYSDDGGSPIIMKKTIVKSTPVAALSNNSTVNARPYIAANFSGNSELLEMKNILNGQTVEEYLETASDEEKENNEVNTPEYNLGESTTGTITIKKDGKIVKSGYVSRDRDLYCDITEDGTYIISGKTTDGRELETTITVDLGSVYQLVAGSSNNDQICLVDGYGNYVSISEENNPRISVREDGSYGNEESLNNYIYGSNPTYLNIYNWSWKNVKVTITIDGKDIMWEGYVGRNRNRIKKEVQRMINNNKGITLLALVVTVIILLILAGVSILTLSGENGLINRAKNSNEEIRGAQVEEEKKAWEVKKEGKGDSVQSVDEFIKSLGPKGSKLLTKDDIDEINETGKVTIGSRTITFFESSQNLLYDVQGLYTGDSSSSGNMQYYAGLMVNFLGNDSYLEVKSTWDSKATEEKESIIVDYAKNDDYERNYFKEKYPGQEIDIDLIYESYGVNSIEEYENSEDFMHCLDYICNNKKDELAPVYSSNQSVNGRITVKKGNEIICKYYVRRDESARCTIYEGGQYTIVGETEDGEKFERRITIDWEKVKETAQPDSGYNGGGGAAV